MNWKHSSRDLDKHEPMAGVAWGAPQHCTQATLHAAPLRGERQEANADEKVAEEDIFLHTNQARRRRRTHPASVAAEGAIKTASMSQNKSALVCAPGSIQTPLKLTLHPALGN